MKNLASRFVTVFTVGLLVSAGAIILLVAVLAGNSAPRIHHHRQILASTKPPARALIETSAVKAYTSLSQLRQDATSVAILTPTSVTRVETIGPVPFALTTVTVSQQVGGVQLPTTLELRQLGDGSAPGYPVVSPGNRYLAYIQPFELHRGVPVPGEYVVIGGLQGLFEDAGGSSASPAGASESFRRVDGDASALPMSVTAQQASAS